ncbi:MAG: ribonuclease Z [Balneolaceae bacterium]
MIIVPLGVASATPTATRHLPSVALWREGSICLFDCGENTQMRMLQAGLKRSKVDFIFITHFDVDHYAGLIGLLSTLQLQRRETPITLAGPKGLQEYVEWNFKFADTELTFETNFVELDENFEGGRVIEEDEFYIEARPLKHTKFCVGYRFQEKDKPGKVDAEKAVAMGISEDWQYKELKSGNDVELEDGTVVESGDIVGHPRPGDSFAYVTDTGYSPNAVKLAMNTNILLHEATFSENLGDKASETGHSTSIDAARVANEAQTKLLVITHFSARYTNPFVLLREARKDFFPAWLATELRPIYTDPSHEKGIIQPKVYIKEIDEKSSGGGKPSGRKPDNKQKRFRKRKSSKGKSGNFRTRKKNDNDKPGRPSENYRRKKVDRDRDEDTSRKPRHITPRTPFDDFDRF